MSQLYAIRHAQASLFSDDYDELSEHGVFQSQCLAKFLASEQPRFDQVIVGPCRRHAQTARILSDTYTTQGLSFPPLTVHDCFDEHQVDQFTANVLRNGSSDDSVSRLAEAYDRRNDDPKERERHFQRLFEAVAQQWLRGEVKDTEVESFEAFQQRVTSGFRQILSSPKRAQNVMVVTSVGPISMLLAMALGSDVETAIRTGWRIRNSGVTRLLFSSHLMTLDQFNVTAHLAADDVTYR